MAREPVGKDNRTIISVLGIPLISVRPPKPVEPVILSTCQPAKSANMIEIENHDWNLKRKRELESQQEDDESRRLFALAVLLTLLLMALIIGALNFITWAGVHLGLISLP